MLFTFLSTAPYHVAHGLLTDLRTLMSAGLNESNCCCRLLLRLLPMLLVKHRITRFSKVRWSEREAAATTLYGTTDRSVRHDHTGMTETRLAIVRKGDKKPREEAHCPCCTSLFAPCLVPCPLTRTHARLFGL
uniref:Putative secreted protein n=1 Tax=Anopheles darlingi TaxID=43151 RepID=A0A2M4D6D0_ANODA